MRPRVAGPSTCPHCRRRVESRIGYQRPRAVSHLASNSSSGMHGDHEDTFASGIVAEDYRRRTSVGELIVEAQFLPRSGLEDIFFGEHAAERLILMIAAGNVHL